MWVGEKSGKITNDFMRDGGEGEGIGRLPETEHNHTCTPGSKKKFKMKIMLS